MRDWARFCANRVNHPSPINWERLDQLRQGGWYGTRADAPTAQAARAILDSIRAWATS